MTKTRADYGSAWVDSSVTTATTSAWVDSSVTTATTSALVDSSVTTATTGSFITNGKYTYWISPDNTVSVTYDTTGLAPQVIDNKLHINVKNHKLIINFDL